MVSAGFSGSLVQPMDPPVPARAAVPFGSSWMMNAIPSAPPTGPIWNTNVVEKPTDTGTRF